MRSFDLVKFKEFVEVADISNLSIDSSSVDLCIFSLSLMGTNFGSFI